ncbi:MAG: tRNA adenosine deaminase-associated protein [Nocardioidaceae bacterium]
MTESAVDFAVVAYRDDGEWQVESLPTRVGTDAEALVDTLRPLPSDTGSIGLVSVDEDFFVIARVLGPEVRLLLSDVTAATEWPLASGVVDLLDLPEPDDEEDRQPAGDLGIIADLGVSAMDLGVVCDDPEVYPDEALSDIARRLGFGQQFDELVDAVAV